MLLGERQMTWPGSGGLEESRIRRDMECELGCIRLRFEAQRKTRIEKRRVLFAQGAYICPNQCSVQPFKLEIQSHVVKNSPFRR